MRIGSTVFGILLGTVAALPVLAQDASSAEDPARVILVVNGALGDRSFFDSAARGMQMIEDKYGDAVETEVLEIGDDPSGWEPALLDVSEGDWDLIVGGTFSMSEVFGAVAEQYPDNSYVLFDASLPNDDGRYDNIYMIEYKQNEGSYLGGMLAASLLASGAIPAEAGSALGFTGGMDIPVINDFLVGYIAGAQAITPDIKVAVSYIGSFTDAAKGKEVGLAQFRDGVALSFVAASQAGLGQIQAAAEDGRFILGVDSDQEAVLRESDAARADTVVSSVLKNVDVSLLRAYDLWIAGELPFGQVEKVGLAEGAVGLVETGAMARLADQGTRDAIAEAARAIQAGEIAVPTAFGMEQDVLDALREQVRP
jgi:basic membrane protein A